MFYVSRFFKLAFFDGVCFIIHVFFGVCVCVCFITALVFTMLFLGVLLVFVACDFFWIETPLGLSQK